MDELLEVARNEPVDWDVEPFTTTQAEAVRACLRRIAGTGKGSSRRSVTGAFKRILEGVRNYELQHQLRDRVLEVRDQAPEVPPEVLPQVPMIKIRTARTICQLAKKHGADSLVVKWVKMAFPRGRPRGGPLETYIASIAEVYSDLSGRRPTLTWDEHRDALRGPFADLLRACLNVKGKRIPDGTIKGTLRRVLLSRRGRQT